MKKQGILALVAAIALMGMGSVQAADKKGSAAGGLELSGNVDVVTGWQHDGKNTLGSHDTVNSADTNGAAGLGQLGDFRGAAAAKRDTFNFYIDQVELNVNRTFGENIRIRADLDFGRTLSGSPRGGVNLEQGYVTANIPVGNGLEFLVGRFNTPIGLESVDRNDNIALSFSNTYRFLRPHNTTGVKLYYPFGEHLDWHVYAVNNLADRITNTNVTTTVNDTPIPSYGSRIGFTWGEKGKENVIGLSYAGGPEGIVNPGGAVNKEKHFTHLGDLDFSFHVTDNFIVAGEGTYRQDNKGGACFLTAATSPNCKAIAGQLLLAYNFNETWTAWLRYDYLHDLQGNYTGAATANDQQIHDFTLGTSYQITDGAKMKMEYRLDMGNPAGASNTYYTHGFAFEFAYNF